MNLIFGFFFVASVCIADSGNWADSDSDILGPPYSEIIQSTELLAANNPGLIQIFDYGATQEGRTLRLLVLSRGDLKTTVRPTLYITGSIHGNEYLNIEDRLPLELTEKSKRSGAIQRFIDSGGAIVFVPIVNPDGYDHRMRENLNNVDLNRDWDVPPAHFKGFKEAETRLLSQKLNTLNRELGLSYRVTVDYHCCIGGLLHPWSYLEENAMNAKDLEAHRTIGKFAQDHLGKDIEVGTTGEILGYFPMGTTKDYFYSSYGALSFTYEGRFGVENQYLASHLGWWESIASYVMGEVVSRPFVGFSMVSQSNLFRLVD